MSAQKTKKKLNLKLIASIGLAMVFIVTVVMVMSMAVKVTKGASRTVETPNWVIRLEILNGCAGAGIATEAAKILKNYRDEELEISIVGTGDFDLRKVATTFVVSREKDKAGAEHLARLLGLDDSEVIYKPIENNYRQVSVTLVLGEDYDAAMLPRTSNKE